MNSRKENWYQYSNVHISNVDIHIRASGDWTHVTFQALANQQKGKEDVDQAIEAIDEAIEKKKNEKDDSKKEWSSVDWHETSEDPLVTKRSEIPQRDDCYIHQNVDSHCTVDQNRGTDEVTRVTNANGHCGAHLLNHIYMVQYDWLLSQHVHIVDG